MSHTTFVALAQRYLAERRTMGFDLRIAGKLLLSFARFADTRGQGATLSIETAGEWARTTKRQSSLTWARRIEIVRPFARWLRQHDQRTEVPPGRMFGRAHRRLAPHVYAKSEIRSLLRAAVDLVPRRGLRPASMAALLGLLTCTGMRVSEALALRRFDVDLDSATLVVRRTKFKKSRLVPIHPSAARALRRYAHLRDQLAPGDKSQAFFTVDGGHLLTYSKVRTAFQRLRRVLGWNGGPGRRPRVHDLRHTFACMRLLRWHQQGVDVDRHILDLSTYLGHAKASDTYWYLSGFPELMHVAARRFERFAFAAAEVRS